MPKSRTFSLFGSVTHFPWRAFDIKIWVCPSDVCIWRDWDVPTHQTNVRHWRNNGLKSDIAEWPGLTQRRRVAECFSISTSSQNSIQ